MKVLRAFDLLTGDLEVDNEPAYCPSLFEGFSFCSNSVNSKEKSTHIHVRNERNFVANLISKGNFRSLIG